MSEKSRPAHRQDMNNPKTETSALLDAVTNANEALALIGVGDFMAIMIRRERESGLWLGAVVNGAGITLHEAVGVTPKCAGSGAVDWVCLYILSPGSAAPRVAITPPTTTPLGLPSECYSVQSAPSKK